jgi:RNA recognition motif-containing protein
MDSVIKMKSLPFDASQLDIITFFEGFKLKPNGVQLVVRSDNKPTGEVRLAGARPRRRGPGRRCRGLRTAGAHPQAADAASPAPRAPIHPADAAARRPPPAAPRAQAFVDFDSPEEAGRALREKDHKVFAEKFGDRYVRLIQVSRKEMTATLSLRFGGEGIVKVKGIPFKASANDVRKFFSGYKIKPDGVSFIMHQDGRPTGMAFIEFETPQEAVRAMDKDRAKFGPEYGDRFCMLQLVGRHEMDKVTLQRESEAAAKMMVRGARVFGRAGGGAERLEAPVGGRPPRARRSTRRAHAPSCPRPRSPLRSPSPNPPLPPRAA